MQRIQYILDKLEEDGKAYEWSKIVNTLEYLSKGRNDESDINVRDDDDDDEVFIEGEVDKRTEKEKESGKEDINNKKINVTDENNIDAKTNKINTEKEDIGDKNETNKRIVKKGKKDNDNRNMFMHSMRQKYNQYIYTMQSMFRTRSP